MAYQDEVLADAPVAYYQLSETSGTQAADSSGNGRHGTYINAPTLGVTGATGTGTAVRFDRTSSQRVSIPTTGLPSGASPYTLEAWINPEVMDAQQGIVGIGIYNNTRQANALRLGNDIWGGFVVHYWWGADLTSLANSGGNVAVNAGLALNTWGHVVGTWDGTTRRIYYNGTEIASDTPGAPNVVISDPSIGRTAGGEFFKGAIDEVAIYSTALSAARIKAHYDAGIAAPPPAGTAPPVTGSFGGTVSPPPVTGNLAGTAPSVTGSFGATTSVPPISSDLAGTAPSVTGSFRADLAGVVTSDLAGVAPGVFGSFDGTASGAAFETTTESVNRSNGMTLVTEWSVSVEPPVTTPTRQPAHDYAVATSLPNPTLVEGRPT